VEGRAELIADRGAAAESDDFFRSRAFFDAEGVTHTLRVESRGGEACVPLLVNEIAGGAGLLDAISPYGYPGARLEAGAPRLDPQMLDWSGVGLVSVFVRDRIGHQPFLANATRRSAVQIHDPSKKRNLRSRFADQIRRNEKLGYHIEILPGPDTSTEQRTSFHSLYIETMRRREAEERYFFDPDYLAGILRFERSWLVLCRSPEGSTAAGAITAASDGLLHYYLGGTAEAHLRDSPFKNIAAGMMSLAEGRGMSLNLGGGVWRGDGLEDFKRGFANAELPFWTHEIVCDPEAYARLSEGRGDSRFFPLYRSPAETEAGATPPT
jgi:Acetyltransferase (GNAT) domain